MNRFAVAAALAVQALAVAPWPPPAGEPCTDCPNIVLMFTDDQDMIIGGWDRMDKTKRSIQEQGALATEWRIHTPVCAPSRSELQSGRYFHTIHSTKMAPSPGFDGGATNYVDLGGKVYPYHFATTLRSTKGYVTGLFGKCMNGGCQNHDNKYNTNRTADLHLMGAFDRWFEGIGYENTTFFDNEATDCRWPWSTETNCTTPTFPGGIWSGKGDGYDTSTVGNASVAWLEKVAGSGRPFFAYIAPHAPHSPATPAPWYENDAFCSSIQSPRLPNWNYSGVNHTSCSPHPPSGLPPFGDEPVYWWNHTDFHEVVSCHEYFTEENAMAIDALAQKRCKTLLSVDDVYQAVVDVLTKKDVLDNTYIFVTSDHGFNLGHHMIPQAKLMLYEHSLRIPMLFKGPGIKKNSTLETLATQVDLAPTILGLAGIETPEYMEGRSLVSNLVTELDDKIPASVIAHMNNNPVVVRNSSFVEFYTQGPDGSGWNLKDDWSNTYIGITFKDSSVGNYKLGIFDPYGPQTNFSKPYMFELFDLAADPYELHNIYNMTNATNPDLVDMLVTTTYSWYHCSGRNCH
eukprot:TRINITY_DN9425_c0_g1_i1.p1 TRINITY_DN9425_c0_g1~~TRINITY_DN9425_c0_g1_i1.p1  ORF type:complete len:579 (+),score=79.25 TRINITY_DN9425_c0_g1_i1:25-1737(+)